MAGKLQVAFRPRCFCGQSIVDSGPILPWNSVRLAMLPVHQTFHVHHAAGDVFFSSAI
jgi:hypothetical protein